MHGGPAQPVPGCSVSPQRECAEWFSFPAVLPAQGQKIFLSFFIFVAEAEGKADDYRCVCPHLACSSVFAAQNTWVWWPSTFSYSSVSVFSTVSQLPSLMIEWRSLILSVREQTGRRRDAAGSKGGDSNAALDDAFYIYCQRRWGTPHHRGPGE